MPGALAVNRRHRARWPRRRLAIAAGIAGALALVLALLVLWPFWKLSGQFDELTFKQPSRLFAAPTRLAVGQLVDLDRLVADLEESGYRPAEGGRPPVGRYARSEGTVAVHLRSFPLPAGGRGGGLLEAGFRGARVRRLSLDGAEVESVLLEPPLVGSFYGPDLMERRPVTVDELPEHLIDAVLAAEDARFFRHSGLSFTGIVRAAWVNLRGGEVRQGGSTLTQQLVKNLWLTPDRTMVRKAQEAVLALLLEGRYGKRAILEAYLNEIYLGASGGVNLMGVGAASRAYFGKDAAALDLAEAATLAGMIRAPAEYSPIAHPDRARERRDRVLARMYELETASPEAVERALARPVAASPEPLGRRRAPHFADAMAIEARRRFGLQDLADGGYALFSTLRWNDQRAAQEAVAWGLATLEKSWQKGHAGASPLQAALVSLDPATGGILAYVGGRDYSQSQFDRAGQARRQAGSAFKPIVYAAAFEARLATPASFLEDSPLSVQLAGRKPWTPQNDDRSFHGWVTVRSALEQSYNPATARLALQVGIPEVVELARAMGLTGDLPAYPSVSLGAVEVSPVELATVYATLAASGVRPPVHGLVAVADRYGERVASEPLPEPGPALSPQSAFLVTSVLQGVLERGTGRGARAQGVTGELAGKTGTTNQRRDSWFAGYSPDRATVVWLGYDDNSSTRLSGSRGAVPVWSRFVRAVRPPGGYPVFPQPPGIVSASIDPTTGLLANEHCPAVMTELFREGEAPTEVCDRHSFWSEEVFAFDGGDERRGGTVADRPGGAPARKASPLRRWFRKVFGGGREGAGEREDPEDGGGQRRDPVPR